jgi:hypothetical protein
MAEPAGCAKAEAQFAQALGDTVQVCLPLPTDPEGETIPLPVQATDNPANAPCAPVPQDRCETWLSEFYNGPGNGPDYTGEMMMSAHTVVTSPDGKTVYVGGTSDMDPTTGLSDYDITVLALDAATGQRRWVKHYPVFEDLQYAATYAIDAGPSSVFVTGYATDRNVYRGLTLGIDAATGEQLWTQEFPGSSFDLAASPDGRRVFVTGGRLVPTGQGDRVEAVTVAYDGATGQPVWTDVLADPEPGRFGMLGHRIATDADGSRVAVAASRFSREPGISQGMTLSLVVSTYDGSVSANPAGEGSIVSRADYPTYGVLPAGLVMNDRGDRAYVNHWSNEHGTQILTIGVDTVRGRVMWSHRFAGLNGSVSWTFPWYFGPIALSPNGLTVYVTGYEGFPGTNMAGFTLAAMNAETGARNWEDVHHVGNLGTCLGCGPSVTVSRGGQIVIAGKQPAAFAYQSSAYAYNEYGTLQWTRVFRDGRSAVWNSLVSSPNSNLVYISGSAGTYTASATDRSVDIVVAAYEAA